MTFNVPHAATRVHSLPSARQKPIEPANAPLNPITRKVIDIIEQEQANGSALKALQCVSNESRRNTVDLRAHRADIEAAMSELKKATNLGFQKSLLLGELNCQQQKAFELPPRFDVRAGNAQGTPTATPRTSEVSTLVARRKAALEGKAPTSPAERPVPAPAPSRLLEALRKERSSTEVNQEKVYSFASVIVESLGVKLTDQDGANSREALQSAIDTLKAATSELEGYENVVVRAKFAHEITKVEQQLSEQIRRQQSPMERAMCDFETWFKASRVGLKETELLSQISGFCLKRLLEID